jgi:2'-5' RNA ligase
MAFGISIKISGEAGARLRDLWAGFGRFEHAPSMAALDYPPHVTLAVYDSIPEHRLRKALRSVFDGHPPVRLRFSRLGFFEQPRLVFWVAPDWSEPLQKAHAAVHRQIDPSLCREYYRPVAWVPHCTLATQIGAPNKERAIARSAHMFEPFEVVFDRADCVAFYPIHIIHECSLLKPV